MSSANSDRYPLHQVVLDDVLSANKFPILLLLAIVITALGTVWITHETRSLVSENNELVFEKQALENEYINLKLEETTQGDNTRIEAIATTKLGMKRIDESQEVTIIE